MALDLDLILVRVDLPLQLRLLNLVSYGLREALVHLDLPLVPLVATEAGHRFFLHADCVDLLQRVLIVSSKV